MTLQTIDFQASTEAPPFLLLPLPGRVFAERAERFKTLADNHSLADWLRFLGHLTQAQHEILQTLESLPLPDAMALKHARTHGMPPINATSTPRPDVWRKVVISLIDALIAESPISAHKQLMALRSASPERMEKLADALLNGQPDPADFAELPFIAAALQVVWTALAARLDPTTLALLDTPALCPCCGSLPVISIVRTSAQVNNLRYLHCSLCNTQWNVVRATCTACSSDKTLSYQQIEGSNGAVRAECCDSCQSYLKIIIQEKDYGVDPVADDLATLALDLLVDEAGYSRSGPNLLLLGGAA